MCDKKKTTKAPGASLCSPLIVRHGLSDSLRGLPQAEIQFFFALALDETWRKAPGIQRAILAGLHVGRGAEDCAGDQNDKVAAVRSGKGEERQKIPLDNRRSSAIRSDH